MAAPHVSGTIALLGEADPHPQRLRHRVHPRAHGARARARGRRRARRRGRRGRPRRRGSGARRAPAAAGDLADRGAPGRDQRRRPDLRRRERRRAAWRVARRRQVPNARTGPFVRLPVGTPGRHTVAIAALNPRGSAIGTRRQVFRVTIDRERPRVALAVRRGGLLEVRFRAQAGDGVAGVPEGSLRGADQREPEPVAWADGQGHVHPRRPLLGRGRGRRPAGNVRRVRRVLSWPAGPVGRRLAWNDALVTLRMPFIMARRHRRFDGHYRPRARLARLLAANCEPRSSSRCRRRPRGPRAARSGSGATGARRCSSRPERAGRRYVMEDRDGRLSRGRAVRAGVLKVAAWLGRRHSPPASRAFRVPATPGDVQRAHLARIAIDAGLARVPHSSPG